MSIIVHMYVHTRLVLKGVSLVHMYICTRLVLKGVSLVHNMYVCMYKAGSEVHVTCIGRFDQFLQDGTLVHTYIVLKEVLMSCIGLAHSYLYRPGSQVATCIGLAHS